MGAIIAMVLFWAGFYILPSWVAVLSKKRAGCAICFLNVALGWTVIAWIICMVWALVPDAEKSDNSGGNS